MINVEPLERVLFSNQFGAEADRDVAVFRNQTNYITLKGNKSIANATSDDALTVLDLNPSDSVKISNLTVGDITVPNTCSDIIRNNGDANYTLRVRDTQGVWEFRNRNFRCMNPSNPANGTEMILHDTGGDYRLRIGSQTFAQVGIGVQYNTSYFLNVGGLSNFNQARIATDLELLGNLNLTSSTGDIQVPTSGMDIQKNSGDTQYTLRVRDNQGIWEFRNRKLSCLTTGGAGTVMELQNTATGEVRIGGSSARVGIGTAPYTSYFLDVGGTVRAPIFNASTYFWTPSGAYYLNSDMKMYQRADASNSLNIITSNEINFSLQPNKEADPTTATIALQLNDTNGITINRAVTNNLTFNSIGNIVGEADIISWNRFMFQNASEFKEVLDGQYKLFVRNGDTTGSINLTVGLEASTPEIQLTNGKVNLLGHLDITHDDITGQQRVFINNPDDNGWIRLSNNNLSTLDATTTGVDVYGDLSYTGSLIPSSDERLKKGIKK